MNDISQMWQEALRLIESSVTQANFSTWFKEINILKQEDGVVYLGVPNSFTQEWLEKKFHSYILGILRSLNGQITALKYVIVDQDGKPKPVRSPFVLESFDDFGDYLDADAEYIKEEFVLCLKELRDQAINELKVFTSDEIRKSTAEILAAIKDNKN